MTKSYHPSREKRGKKLILDLLGYYDAKQVITDIARKEVDLDTLKACASLILAGKVIKLPKVIKAIGNVGKTGFKKGKEGEKISKSGQAKQTKARDKGESGSKVDTVSEGGSGNIYKPSPKHDPRSGWGTPNPIPNNKVGQKLLDTAFSSNKNKQLYNYYEGQIIKFQPDGAGGWHSYAVLNIKKEVPIDVLREMLKQNVITKVQYNKFIKNER